MRPMRLKELLARPINAAFGLPARTCLRKLRELTKPVMRKKVDRLARPEMTRRRIGSWKREGSEWSERAGESRLSSSAVKI